MFYSQRHGSVSTSLNEQRQRAHLLPLSPATIYEDADAQTLPMSSAPGRLIQKDRYISDATAHAPLLREIFPELDN